MRAPKPIQVFLGFPKRGAIALVNFYRKYISPMFPPSCRYVPTCSEYAMIALQRYGFIKGSWMAIKRICRCHPWHPGGYDPVP
jgi:putative membrane protein insertion efficiency factor